MIFQFVAVRTEDLNLQIHLFQFRRYKQLRFLLFARQTGNANQTLTEAKEFIPQLIDSV
jgi:hypothetical protein